MDRCGFFVLLGKNVCSLVGLDEAGVVVLRRRLRLDGLRILLAPCRLAPWRWRRAGVPIIGSRAGAAGHTIRADVAGIRSRLCEGQQE